jgi:hypothetical protein
MTRMGGERELASSLFQGEDKRGIILFDGVCNMCNGGVNRGFPPARRDHEVASLAWLSGKFPMCRHPFMSGS